MTMNFQRARARSVTGLRANLAHSVVRRAKPVMRVVLRAFLGVVVLLASGCQKPREKFEAKAKETLALLPSLAEAARAVPPLTAQSADALKAVTDLSMKFKKSNGLLVQIEELENPTVRLALPVRLNQRSPAADVANVLNLVKPVAADLLDAKYDPSCGPESPDWQRMAETRYVLVVRTTEAKEAKMTGAKTFEAGSWVGEILVFELRSKKFLGGFTVTGGNHAWLKTSLGRDQQNLNADLQLAARGNLTAELRKHFPSVGPSEEAN